MADDVWIYDFETKESNRLFSNHSQDIFPMWHGNKIYFTSNRDRIMNLFVYDFETKETRKLTNYDNYDIKFPSLGDGRIIYENGGFLHVFDLNRNLSAKLKFRLPMTLSGHVMKSKMLPKTLAHQHFRPMETAYCYQHAAIFLRFLQKVALPATSHNQALPTTALRPGRPMANGLHTFPTSTANMKSTSRNRMAASHANNLQPALTPTSSTSVVARQ
jgi:hypothetical protein